MRKSLLIIGFIGVAVGIAANRVGDLLPPVWGRIMEWFRTFDQMLMDWEMYPSLIAAGAIFIMLGALWPQITESIFGYQAFLERQKDVYQKHKSIFHMHLNEAYLVWRGQHPDAPETLNKLVDETPLPLSHAFLSNDTDQVRGALIAANKNLWDFCTDLYKEIETAKGSRVYNCGLLFSRQDCIEFSDARKGLTDFWNMEGRRVLGRIFPIFRPYRLRQMEQQLQDRSLRILPFLEAALATEIETKLGANYLLRMSEKAFTVWRQANT